MKKLLNTLGRIFKAVWFGWRAIFGLYPKLPKGVVCAMGRGPLAAGQMVGWVCEDGGGDKGKKSEQMYKPVVPGIGGAIVRSPDGKLFVRIDLTADEGLNTAALAAVRTIHEQWPKVNRIAETLGGDVGMLHAALAANKLTEAQRIEIHQQVLRCRAENRARAKAAQALAASMN